MQRHIYVLCLCVRSNSLMAVDSTYELAELMQAALHRLDLDENLHEQCRLKVLAIHKACSKVAEASEHLQQA